MFENKVMEHLFQEFWSDNALIFQQWCKNSFLGTFLSCEGLKHDVKARTTFPGGKVGLSGDFCPVESNLVSHQSIFNPSFDFRAQVLVFGSFFRS